LKFASHNQLHLYGFSDVVNLLNSLSGTALDLKDPTTLNKKTQRFVDTSKNGMVAYLMLANTFI